MQATVSVSPVASPRRIVVPWWLLWVLYNVVICGLGWAFWEMESYNKDPSDMIRVEPWEWWMLVIEAWGLANACFAVGPLLELMQLRWYRRTAVTKALFFFLILSVSVVVVGDWAIRFKNDYLINGQSNSWEKFWPPRE
jgi:hypothetical protein